MIMSVGPSVPITPVTGKIVLVTGSPSKPSTNWLTILGFIRVKSPLHVQFVTKFLPEVKISRFTGELIQEKSHLNVNMKVVTENLPTLLTVRSIVMFIQVTNLTTARFEVVIRVIPIQVH